MESILNQPDLAAALSSYREAFHQFDSLQDTIASFALLDSEPPAALIALHNEADARCIAAHQHLGCVLDALMGSKDRDGR